MIGKNVTIRSQAELQASQTSAPTQGFQGCENPDLQNHPRTRFSCHAALDEAACAPFSKERLMKFANATKFHRKSGEGAT